LSLLAVNIASRRRVAPNTTSVFTVPPTFNYAIKNSGGYTGNIVTVRDTGGTERDYTGDEILNGTLATDNPTGQATVAKFLNQGLGANVPLEQPVATAQGILANSGTVNTDANGNPFVNLAQGSDFYEILDANGFAPFHNNNPFTVALVFSRETTHPHLTYFRAINSAVGRGVHTDINGTGTRILRIHGYGFPSHTRPVVDDLIVIAWVYTGSVFRFYFDKVFIGEYSMPNSVGIIDEVQFFAHPPASRYGNANLRQVAIWDSDQEVNLSSIFTIFNQDWGV
jgi:hypothetical protein